VLSLIKIIIIIKDLRLSYGGGSKESGKQWIIFQRQREQLGPGCLPQADKTDLASDPRAQCLHSATGQSNASIGPQQPPATSTDLDFKLPDVQLDNDLIILPLATNVIITTVHF
jgi:hypothetical protein